MLYTFADLVAESKHEHDTGDEESYAKDDIAERPAVVERSEDENDLEDDVDGHAHDGEEQLHYPKTRRRFWGHACDTLESADGHKEADGEEDE